VNPNNSFRSDPSPPPRPDGPDVREHVRRYVRRGWCVLPLWWPTSTCGCACGLPDCDSAGKHPIPTLVPHGLRDATDRDHVADAWWRLYPRANVGIRTGADSGLVVLDVDRKAGRLTLRGLVAHYGRFDARWARTGSGGWHAYFAHPGIAVSNSAGRIGIGLDVRGDGGYVVAPPSRHRSRRSYQWIRQCEGVERPPVLPAWLLELSAPSAERRWRQPLRLLSGDAGVYAAAAIEREGRDVAQAPAGRRNDQLVRSAFKLGQLVGAGLADESTVTEALVRAGLAAGPGERKIRSTIGRGLRAGMRRPREVLLRSESVPPSSEPPGEVERC
jgi:Bifunctional DNA primase/polymerase, N-terminal